MAASLIFPLFAVPMLAAATPCIDITEAAEGKPEEEAASNIFSQCQLSRPQEGLTGLDEPERDCHELAHLYEMARHYDSSTFSAADFCSTVKSYTGSELDADVRLVDHSACVVQVDAVLSSADVSNAAEKACRRISPQSVHSAVVCAQFATALVSAPKGELVSSTRLCDKLVTGRDNGTQSFDEQHFVYSCVQYASNLMAGMPTDDQSDDVAGQVQESCEAHLATEEKDFCSNYAGLVRQHASRARLVQFCDLQYRSMRAKESGNGTTPSSAGAVQPAPGAVSATAVHLAAQPVQHFQTASEQAATSKSKSLSQAPTVKQTKCEQYLSGIKVLGLSSAESGKIVQMDCPNRFGISGVACSQVARLFQDGRVFDACSLAAPKPAPPKPKAPPKKQVDMRKVCQSVLSKMTATGLQGPALERATIDVCANELFSLPAAEQPPKLRVHVGCRFFAKHLSQENEKNHGAVSTKQFCSNLVAKGSAHAKESHVEGVGIATPVILHSAVAKSATKKVVTTTVSPVTTTVAEEIAVTTTAFPVTTTVAVTAAANAAASVETFAERAVLKPAEVEPAMPPEASAIAKLDVGATPPGLHEPSEAVKQLRTVQGHSTLTEAPAASTGGKAQNPRRLAEKTGKATKKMHAAAATAVAVAAQKDDEDFLNSFLNKYQEKKTAEMDDKNKHKEDIHQRASALFGDGAPPPLVLTQESSSPSDAGEQSPPTDFLSGFLDQNDDAPHTAAPASAGEADVDSLMSSFVTSA